MNTKIKTLRVESGAFEHNGFMPDKYTGRGEDISPELRLGKIDLKAQSIAIIMDDLDVPVVGVLNHWLLWNVPVQNVIPENIPHGETVSALSGAVQGIGYGKHEYRGPKPPSFIKKAHRYQFHVYVLDSKIELGSGAKKKDLLRTMEGHILQYGCLMGRYRNK